MNNKKIIIPLCAAVLLLIGGVVWLSVNLNKQKNENKDMQALAAMDKSEMENEYQQFANQYSEMKSTISNDSIVAQLTAEQKRTESLLRQLRHTKSTDAREIARLKRELTTVRAVLRSYVIEIDSLNRLNQNLTAENTRVRGQYEAATRQIEGLNTEKASLSEKVAIASQLDATGINLTGMSKHGGSTNKTKKIKTIAINFNLAKNVTAATGMKTLYVVVTSPTGSTLGSAGNFKYENRMLECTARKSIEYSGAETPVTVYWPVTEALTAGSYRISVFADGNMIGSRSVTLK